MGNKATRQEKQRFIEQFAASYTKEKDIDDDRFGKVAVYRENANPDNRLFVKSLISEHINEVRVMKDLCELRSRVQHPALLRFLGYSTEAEGQFCTLLNRIDCYGEYFEHNLEQEIDNRFSKKQYFPEVDIWLIAYQLIEAEQTLLAQRFHCGDIRPVNILLTNSGEIKVLDQQMFPNCPDGYTRFLTTKAAAYLAPEEFKNARQRITRPSYSHELADVFSFGVTLLQAANLGHTGCYHDYQRQCVNDHAINEALVFSKSIYSAFLVNFIRACLQESSIDRPDFTEMQAVLKPYETQIKSAQPFQPNYDKSKQSLSKSPVRKKHLNHAKSKHYTDHTLLSEQEETKRPPQDPPENIHRSSERTIDFYPQLITQSKLGSQSPQHNYSQLPSARNLILQNSVRQQISASTTPRIYPPITGTPVAWYAQPNEITTRLNPRVGRLPQEQLRQLEAQSQDLNERVKQALIQSQHTLQQSHQYQR